MARGLRKNAVGGLDWGGMINALRDLRYTGPTYRLTLPGKTPDRLAHQPLDMIPGDAARGQSLLENRYTFLGHTIAAEHGPRPGSTAGGPPWGHQLASEAWYSEMQAFGWLRDLRAVANTAAVGRARKLVLDWIEKHAPADPRPWQPEILGERIASWLAHGGFLLKDADSSFTQHYFESLTAQIRQLTRTVRTAQEGGGRVAALKGLIYAGLCLPDGGRRASQALGMLDAELARQILPDGGQAERSPAVHFTLVRHLADIRGTLIAVGRPVPDTLQTSIERMAVMLRAYRHGDGSLALFNDSTEEEPWLIDLALAQSEFHGRPQSSAPHTGFWRIEAGRTLLISDLGRPSPVGHHTHAGTLSFELGFNRERLIVNCGAARDGDSAWRRALRATAAHSTLTIDDTNSTEILEDGGIGRRPEAVDAAREEQAGATWLEARHDGYKPAFGLVHRRRFYVSADGSDVRGEDLLIRTESHGRSGKAFAVRFHFHPDVEATLAPEGGSIQLRLLSGSKWQFRATGGDLELSESIYAGKPGERRDTSQAVITGPIESDDTVVKWAIRRVPG